MTTNATTIKADDTTFVDHTVFPESVVAEGNPEADTWVSTEFSAQGKVRAGIWEGQPGKINVASYPTDEIFTVLSGRIQMTNEDGSIVIVNPGESALLRKGWKGMWHTVEPTRKSFVNIGE